MCLNPRKDELVSFTEGDTVIVISSGDLHATGPTSASQKCALDGV